jgi:hypothetical protein
MTSTAPFSAVGRTLSRSLTDLTEAVAPPCADGPVLFRSDFPFRGPQSQNRPFRTVRRARREEAVHMKRRRLAALLGACLVSASLALAPLPANAWWIGQPRFEKQVITEGDPEGPDVMIPGSGVDDELESPSSSDDNLTSALIEIVLQMVEL